MFFGFFLRTYCMILIITCCLSICVICSYDIVHSSISCPSTSKISASVKKNKNNDSIVDSLKYAGTNT